MCLLFHPSSSPQPHLIYMLRPTFTGYLFLLFASEDRGVDSSLPQWILLRYMHTDSHCPVSPQSLSLRAWGYAVSCRLGLSLGVCLEANLREKKRWKKKDTWSRFLLWIESREWKRDLQNECEFRQGSGGAGCGGAVLWVGGGGEG